MFSFIFSVIRVPIIVCLAGEVSSVLSCFSLFSYYFHCVQLCCSVFCHLVSVSYNFSVIVVV